MFPRSPSRSYPVSQFLSRASQGLEIRYVNAYTRLIDGLVQDGIWNILDQLLIFATDTSANALLNLKSRSFVPTAVSSPTFTADQGYAGDGAASYIDTNFTPSTAGGNFTQDSASIGVYGRTNRTTDALTDAFGCQNVGATSNIEMIAVVGGNQLSPMLNDATGGANFANSTARGMYVFSRTGSANFALHKNGASMGTMTATSVALPDRAIFVGGRNVGYFNRGTTDQHSAWFIGGGLTATQMTKIASRINTYMTALGTNVY